LQCLKTLQIDDFGMDMSYSIEHIFELAPRLWKASLRSQFVYNSSSSSWAQLTELDASNVWYTVEDCLALLQSIMHLQKLRVCIGSGIVEGHYHLVFSHPLASLRAMGAGMLFDYITLPSLHKLSVDEICSKWLVSQFISFLERSSPPFQSFSHKVSDIVNDNNMIQILQHMPSLRSLCLVYTWSGVDTHFFLERLSAWILNSGQVHCWIPSPFS
jgi:hypothetical protein